MNPIYRISDYLFRLCLLMASLIFVFLQAASFDGFTHVELGFYIQISTPIFVLLVLTILQLIKKEKSFWKYFFRILSGLCVLFCIGFQLMIWFGAFDSRFMYFNLTFIGFMLIFMFPFLIFSTGVFVGLIKQRI